MSHQATQIADVVIDIQIKGDVIINFFNLNFLFLEKAFQNLMFYKIVLSSD